MRLLLLAIDYIIFPVWAHIRVRCHCDSSERKALFQTDFEEEKKGPEDDQRRQRQGDKAKSYLK